MQFVSKEEWRKTFLIKRDQLSKAQHTSWDTQLTKSFLKHELVQPAKRISCYVGYASEMNTLPLINSLLQRNKKVCVPRIISKKAGMEMVDITSVNDLQEGKYGIQAPAAHLPAIQDTSIDIIIVPGLVFDQHGYRIGYGGGFYDRFLSNHPNSHTIALAYPFQQATDLPHDWYDIPVKEVLYPLD